MAEDAGKAVLRLALGVTMLLHGLGKLDHGVAGIAAQLAAKGLPEFIAYGAYLGEVVAPLMLITGLGSRIGGLLLSGTMIVAIGLVHAADVFVRNPRSGGSAIELPMLFLLGGVAVALLGSGRYALSKGEGRWD